MCLWLNAVERRDGVPEMDLIPHSKSEELVPCILSREYIGQSLQHVSSWCAGEPPCGKKRERWQVSETDGEGFPVACKLVAEWKVAGV